MKKFFFCIFALTTLFSQVNANEKIYIDCDELDTAQNCIRIHTGDNIWIQTDVIHNDHTGFFTFESNIKKSPKMDYEKSWKCPYCYRYWPIGKPCQNPQCPSKY